MKILKNRSIQSLLGGCKKITEVNDPYLVSVYLRRAQPEAKRHCFCHSSVSDPEDKFREWKNIPGRVHIPMSLLAISIGQVMQ